MNSRVVVVNFEFEVDVLFHCEPVEQQFDENLRVLLRKKIKLSQAVGLIAFALILDDEVVHVINNISDGLLL